MGKHKELHKHIPKLLIYIVLDSFVEAVDFIDKHQGALGLQLRLRGLGFFDRLADVFDAAEHRADAQKLGVEGLRAKHISEFEGPDAPKMAFIFTVCDAAAAEDCAPWPGQPMTAHWGVPDPVKATGTDAEKGLAFASAFSELNRRITAFAALSIDQLDRLALQRSLDTIGLTRP